MIHASTFVRRVPHNVTVTDDDVGKRVVDRSGTVVGSVAEARNGVAYIDPDTAITATHLATLGGSYADEGSSFRIDPATIERVADREIRIRYESLETEPEAQHRALDRPLPRHSAFSRVRPSVALACAVRVPSWTDRLRRGRHTRIGAVAGSATVRQPFGSWAVSY